MTDKPVLTLVVSSSGDSQDGLLALMTTIPPIGAVLVSDDIASALRLVKNHQPALAIFDISSLQELEVIKKIKTQWPHISLIVIVEDIAQGKVAEESGVDRVLVKGFSPEKLITVVEDIIAPREDNPTLDATTKSSGDVIQISE